MIIKWAGGKNWLYKKHENIFPDSYNNYIEPFFGGGSVFFNMFPKKAYLSDVNEKLINFYVDLKNDPEKLFLGVNRLMESHSDEQYYAVRDQYNNPRSTSSVYFLYLNRTCFNGIYRENRKGEFNVPVGRRKSSYFPFTMKDFLQLSLQLKNTNLQNCDFREALKRAKKGDFIYLDPPYIEFEKEYDSFRRYNGLVFSKSDLEDLALEANRLKGKCKILISNFDQRGVKDYFTDKEWKFKSIKQMTYLSGKKEGRKHMNEALIYNY